MTLFSVESNAVSLSSTGATLRSKPSMHREESAPLGSSYVASPNDPMATFVLVNPVNKADAVDDTSEVGSFIVLDVESVVRLLVALTLLPVTGMSVYGLIRTEDDPTWVQRRIALCVSYRNASYVDLVYYSLLTITQVATMYRHVFRYFGKRSLLSAFVRVLVTVHLLFVVVSRLNRNLLVVCGGRADTQVISLFQNRPIMWVTFELIRQLALFVWFVACTCVWINQSPKNRWTTHVYIGLSFCIGVFLIIACFVSTSNAITSVLCDVSDYIALTFTYTVSRRVVPFMSSTLLMPRLPVTKMHFKVFGGNQKQNV